MDTEDFKKQILAETASGLDRAYWSGFDAAVEALEAMAAGAGENMPPLVTETLSAAVGALKDRASTIRAREAIRGG